MTIIRFSERRRPLNWILIPAWRAFFSSGLGRHRFGAERGRHHLRHRRALSISLSDMPFARAQDSTAASPYCATAFFTTQQGMAYAGNENTNVATTTMARI